MTINNAQTKILDTIVGHTNKTKPEDRDHREADQYDEGMLGTVALIAEQLHWAWGEAWEVSTQRRERGQVHKPLTDEEKAKLLANPDYVKAAGVDDLGQGNYLAQAALRANVTHLPACDLNLDRCCRIALPAETGRRLPVVSTIETATLVELLAALASIRWRLNYLRDHAPTLDDAKASQTLRFLNKADRELRLARTPLAKAHRAATKDASISVDKTCQTCGRRAVRRGGTECPTCDTYRSRNKKPRPTSLDEDAA